MGARQPTRLTATAYGLPEDAVANAQAGDAGGTRSGMYALFALVIALAVATLWYVARPALEQKPIVERSCEVIVLRSGAPEVRQYAGTGNAREPRGVEAARRQALTRRSPSAGALLSG